MKHTFPRILSVTRSADNPNAVLVSLVDAPSDDELSFFGDYLRSWTCAAMPWSKQDPPQECNWPVCGCDAHADRVIAALGECGLLKDALVTSTA